MSKLINISQTTGTRIVTSFDKEMLKLVSAVATHPQLYTESAWGMVSFVYKHTLSSKRLVASFKNFDAETTMKIKSGMNSGDEFQLKKIIISGPGRQPKLVLSRSQIEQVSQLDFILGQVDQPPTTSNFSVSISSASASIVSAPYSVSVSFSKSVTGFTLSDLLVSNAQVSNLSGSGANYSFTVSPIEDGAVSISVKPNSVIASDGSTNNASSELERTYFVPATVALSTEGSSFGGEFVVTATFSKPVTDFSLTSISIINGVASNLVGSGSSYSFTVTPVADGVVSVNVNSEFAQPTAGFEGGAEVSYSSPATSSVSSLASQTVYDGFGISVSFDKPVVGFDLSDISITNGIAANLSGSGTSYSFDVIPTQAGTVEVKILANVGSSFSQESNTISVTYEVPELELSSNDVLVYVKEDPAISLNTVGASLSPSGSYLVSGSGALTSSTDLVSSYVTKIGSFDNEIEFVPDMSEYKSGAVSANKDEYKFERQKITDGSFYARTVSEYNKSVSSNSLEKEELKIRKVSNLNCVEKRRTMLGQTSKYLIFCEKYENTSYNRIVVINKQNNSAYYANALVDQDVISACPLFDPKEDAFYFFGYRLNNTNIKIIFIIDSFSLVPQGVDFATSNANLGLYWPSYSLRLGNSFDSQATLVYEDGYMKPFFSAYALNSSSATKTNLKLFKLHRTAEYYSDGQQSQWTYEVMPAVETNLGGDDGTEDLFSINSFGATNSLHDNLRLSASQAIQNRLYFVAKNSSGYYSPYVYSGATKTAQKIGPTVSWNMRVFGSWKLARMASSGGAITDIIFFITTPQSSSANKVCAVAAQGLNPQSISIFYTNASNQTANDGPQGLVSAGNSVYFSGIYLGSTSVRKLYRISGSFTFGINYAATAVLSHDGSSAGTTKSHSIGDNPSNIIPIGEAGVIFVARNPSSVTKLYAVRNDSSTIYQMTNIRASNLSDNPVFLGYVTASGSLMDGYIYISAINPNGVTKLYKILAAYMGMTLFSTSTHVTATSVSVDSATKSDSFNTLLQVASVPLMNGFEKPAKQNYSSLSASSQYPYSGMAVDLKTIFVAIGETTTSSNPRNLYALNGSSEELILNRTFEGETLMYGLFSANISSSTANNNYSVSFNTDTLYFNDGNAIFKKTQKASGSWGSSSVVLNQKYTEFNDDQIFDHKKWGDSIYFRGRNHVGKLKLFRLKNSEIEQVSPNSDLVNDNSYVIEYYNNKVYFVSYSFDLKGHKLFVYDEIDKSVTNLSNLSVGGSDFATTFSTSNPVSLLDSVNKKIFFVAPINSSGHMKLFVLDILSESISQVSNIYSSGSDLISGLTIYDSKIYFSASSTGSTSNTKIFVCQNVSGNTYTVSKLIDTSGSASVSDGVDNLKATKIQIINDRIYFVAKNSSGIFVLHKVRHDSSGISYNQLNISMYNPQYIDHPFQVKNYNGIPHIYFVGIDGKMYRVAIDGDNFNATKISNISASGFDFANSLGVNPNLFYFFEDGTIISTVAYSDGNLSGMSNSYVAYYKNSSWNIIQNSSVQYFFTGGVGVALGEPEEKKVYICDTYGRITWLFSMIDETFTQVKNNAGQSVASTYYKKYGNVYLNVEDTIALQILREEKIQKMTNNGTGQKGREKEYFISLEGKEYFTMRTPDNVTKLFEIS